MIFIQTIHAIVTQLAEQLIWITAVLQATINLLQASYIFLQVLSNHLLQFM